MPKGWRTSRRGSRTYKKARKEVKTHERREKVATGWTRGVKAVQNGAYLLGVGLVAIAAVGLVVVLIAMTINGVVRWNARRVDEAVNSPEARAEKARENLLFIADTEGTATGFLAVRYDADAKMVYGIAVPDATFLEVPGQGFEKVGDSYHAGPDVSMDALTNFFGVPFESYVVIDSEIYQTAMVSQSLGGVMQQAKETNLEDDGVESWTAALDGVKTENVALVPMPVKQISLGSQTYFEPQVDEIAGLVEQWWGVDMRGADDTVRAIVYNGSGIPGIAGVAAQELIRGGYRVVDTRNADAFDYETTQIVVQNGELSVGEPIRELLGVGEVTKQEADQQIADVIIIIGKDYESSQDGA